jgi:hypothetical protein
MSSGYDFIAYGSATAYQTIAGLFLIEAEAAILDHSNGAGLFQAGRLDHMLLRLLRITGCPSTKASQGGASF